MKLYITHCSATKLKPRSRVTPDRLYASRNIKAFMRRCKEQRVEWAIFSDLYGVWFPHFKHPWYEWSPDTVLKDEELFRKLVRDFDDALSSFTEIWFYYHPARFHSLYRKLLRKSALTNRIKKFKHIADIHP